MAQPPLTLSLPKLTPLSCIPTIHPPSPLTLVPHSPVPIPPPPSSFNMSPSPHYAGPFGIMSLGESIKSHVVLTNTSNAPVIGVKMMIEVQGPNGRYRLGELKERQLSMGMGIDSPPEEGVESELEVDGQVDLEVEGEMKDVGLNVLIVSVAWETTEGRKTFQRFLKFNVTPPLAIKTRIHTPVTPMFLLDPTRRSDLHLEVLVHNTSMTGLVFDKVLLEPVKGLLSSSATNSEIVKLKRDQADTNETLFPDDTRQYLFTLSPDDTYPTKEGESSTPRSVFPPSYTSGSILPLGRLDMAWFSAPYRETGRLQTSTLNRRVPPPAAPARPVLPSRTTSTVPTIAGPSIAPIPILNDPNDQEWEYDLVLLHCQRQVEMEQEFKVTVRVALRTKTKPVDAPRLALQYLSRERVTARSNPLVQPTTGQRPTFALSPPSRTSTPASSRPFSPPTTTASRPMTPVSTQLRQATSSNIAQTPIFPLPSSTSHTTYNDTPPFPPPPYTTAAGPSKVRAPKGQIVHLGTSLTVLPLEDVRKVTVNHGVTYDEAAGVEERWEVIHELSLRFMALDEGLCELGGIRVLHLDGTVGVGGSVGRQWDSLGDLWVSS